MRIKNHCCLQYWYSWKKWVFLQGNFECLEISLQARTPHTCPALNDYVHWRKLLISHPQKPRNPPVFLCILNYDCDRIFWIAMRFFGLLSRLWASNPVKSRGNPPNCGAIHHNHDCEGFRNPTQSKGFSHNQWRLQADCVCGCNTNAEQGNIAIEGEICVQTWFEQ